MKPDNNNGNSSGGGNGNGKSNGKSPVTAPVSVQSVPIHLDFDNLHPSLKRGERATGPDCEMFPGLYVTGLARLIGYRSASNLSTVLKGNRRPGMDTARRISKALGVSLDTIAGLYKDGVGRHVPDRDELQRGAE